MSHLPSIYYFEAQLTAQRSQEMCLSPLPPSTGITNTDHHIHTESLAHGFWRPNLSLHILLSSCSRPSFWNTFYFLNLPLILKVYFFMLYQAVISAWGWPVLLGDMEGHELQRIQTLHQPALAFTDSRDIHLQELVGHPAPQNMWQELYVQTWGTLGNRVFVFTFKQSCWERHHILECGADKRKRKKKVSAHVTWGSNTPTDRLHRKELV